MKIRAKGAAGCLFSFFLESEPVFQFHDFGFHRTQLIFQLDGNSASRYRFYLDRRLKKYYNQLQSVYLIRLKIIIFLCH